MAIPWVRILGGIAVVVSVIVLFWWTGDVTNLKTDSPSKEPVLTRIDPVKVGHVREIHLVSGQVHKMKTLSMRPALFEIENFLSDDECDDIIGMAERQGFKKSSTQADDPALAKNLKFNMVDVNNNGVIDKSEFVFILMRIGDILVTDDVLEEMMVEFELDTDRNAELSYEEYVSMMKPDNLQKIINYAKTKKQDAPNKEGRLSNTAFLNPLAHVDKKTLFENIKNRIQRVTGLPKDIIWASEYMQVLKYDKYGHYHCHFDSANEEFRPNVPCCHYLGQATNEECVPCRYISFFYYLNEPEEGGETAFPIADNGTNAFKLLRGEKRHLCDLSTNCHKAKIAYKPKRGTALFWYNHQLNEETGWLGQLDKHSIHGGCDVIRGTKWAANNWINVGKDRELDEKAWANYKQHVEDNDNQKGEL